MRSQWVLDELPRPHATRLCGPLPIAYGLPSSLTARRLGASRVCVVATTPSCAANLHILVDDRV